MAEKAAQIPDLSMQIRAQQQIVADVGALKKTGGLEGAANSHACTLVGGLLCDVLFKMCIRDSGCYAGEGDIPLAEWVQAVKDTGYDGWWSYELVSAKHWQADTATVAAETSRLLDCYVFDKA